MEASRSIDQRRRAALTSGIVVILTMAIAIGLYATTPSTSSNTIEIIPLGGAVPGGGAGGNGFGSSDPNASSTSGASLVEIGEKFGPHRGAGKPIVGQVITRIDLPGGVANGNLLLEVIWTNSNEVGGLLKKPDEFLQVGLYFFDTDQRKADDNPANYSGSCDKDTQLEFVQDEITRWLCPDTNELASTKLTEESAFGIIGSSIDGHSTFYVLAHIPAVDDGDDDGNGKGKNEDGSKNPGQIKQMEFTYTIISAS